ncbi:hypothetical protein NC653_032691 [Populus alba x Populus x berolinensis]|uniref:Uncharacterized protein n=1 Tax=Populus alba x Populus x berolinensis TaxID=444605 RepID=A0AAD6PZD1_9ROSI|nr:hypothetical protein NC653_032691 [Populus alba x Populus x berolinensis]
MAKDAYENQEFSLQDEKKLKEPLLFANACGAISVYRRAAIPAVPPKDAVLKVLRPGALLE